jgi:anti-sigma regulatory factor (Ser/Thr protein kinase)
MSAAMAESGGSPAAGPDDATCDDQSPGPVSYLELAAISSAPFWARRQASAVLNAWQLPDEAVEIAQLIVSELVTNSVMAASPGPAAISSTGLDGICRIALTLRLLPGRVVIEVLDTHPDPPVPCDAGPDDEAGRGLVLVQALAKEWGHFFRPSGGKVVYAVIAVAPAGRQPRL